MYVTITVIMNLGLLELWRPLLPGWILQHVLDQLVLVRLQVWEDFYDNVMNIKTRIKTSISSEAQKNWSDKVSYGAEILEIIRVMSFESWPTDKQSLFPCGTNNGQTKWIIK